MQRFVYQYNAHKYSDHSDTPALQTKVFLADCEEMADGLAYNWRDESNNGRGRCHADGRQMARPYVGIIHFPANRG